MDASGWLTSALALLALIVSVAAFWVSWRSMNAAEESAQAAVRSATAEEQAALLVQKTREDELARNGIVEFGPWRAESIDSKRWRVVNTGNEPLYFFEANHDNAVWRVDQGEVVMPGHFATIVIPEFMVDNHPKLMDIRWSESSAPETRGGISTIVLLHHRLQ